MSNKENIISLKQIKESIPDECFKKRPLLGFYYIIRDFVFIFSAYTAFQYSPQTLVYKLLYWNVSGLFMWSLFVDGHDCGHQSFSDSYLLNTIVGHICHTPLLVPYSTWADSHHLHHLHHNHVKNDYSHVWVPEHYKNKKSIQTKILSKSGLMPFLGFFLYLSGIVDGGHWLPFGGRLWKNNTIFNFIHSCISSGFVGTFLYYVLKSCNYNFQTFMIYYGYSWFIFSFWLVTTTYLQHHDDTLEDTIVYGDNSWNFVKGALQTVDRSYGVVIDNLTHNITDCHLIHHLFFKTIPHYHLKKATKHLYAYLDKNNIPYKRRKTHDFVYKIFYLTYQHLNEAVLVK